MIFKSIKANICPIFIKKSKQQRRSIQHW